MKLVLFDCDGTLVDSAGIIHGAMLKTFDHFGKREPLMEETKSIIGLTLDLAIAKMQGREHVDDESAAMAAFYKAIFLNVLADDLDERLFPGIPELFDLIGPRDELLIGAVTGKSRRGLDRVITKYDFGRYFVVGRTADECPSKPHPAMVTECCDQMGMLPKDTLVVGDAIYDMQMAKAAGATAIGVSWGYAPVEGLKAAGADAIIHHPSELLGYFG